MKISKESLKFTFKRKESYIAISFFVLFLLSFLSSFLNVMNEYKGIRDFTNSVKVKDIYSNNSSIIYVVGEDNNLYYSFNKKYKGHLNYYAGIETLDNEFGDATKNYYNFIKIDYQFINSIIKVDGFRDDVDGNNGYTLILDSIGNLYAIYGDIKKPIIIERNVKDFDVGHENFAVFHFDNTITEFVFKNRFFYSYKNDNSLLLNKQLRFISVQGGNISYYVDYDNQLYEAKSLIDYENMNNYEIESTTIDYIKNIKNPIYTIEIVDKTLYNNEEILQIESIEKTTIIRTIYSLYGRGDSFYYEYGGIFATSSRLENSPMYRIDYNVENIEKMYLCGSFALIIKQEDDFYYTGNLFGYNVDEFKKIDNFGRIDYVIGNYSSVIIFKDNVIYRIGDSGKLENLYDHKLVVLLVRYISLFILLMIFLYIIMMFVDETKRYNRYKNIEVKL